MKMGIYPKRPKTLATYLFLAFIFVSCGQEIKSGSDTSEEKIDTLRDKTVFQTSSPWMPEIDIRADVAIVYGINGNPSDGRQKLTFEEHLKFKEGGSTGTSGISG